MIHKFVEFFPDELEDGIIYVSIPYATANHRCCCGCGNEVVTPLSPTDWKLTFDGVSITLYPSIGNWSFDCKSHYWITNNKIVWASRWSEEEISVGRRRDLLVKTDYYSKKTSNTDTTNDAKVVESKIANTLWLRFKKWWSSFWKIT